MVGSPSPYLSFFLLVGLLLLMGTRPAPGQTTQEERVTVTFEVIVPEKTPPSNTVFWTGSSTIGTPGIGAMDLGRRMPPDPPRRERGTGG